ncbi:MAG: tRNA pseudouridine(55) synthase TruB [Pseudomonadota bacterium]
MAIAVPPRGQGTAKRDVSGVLLLDKAPGLSSNGALQAVKRLYRARKAGHTGTLDPMATGLLPICFGEASKFSAGLLSSDKGYRATLRLGERTDTGDREGRVLAARKVTVSLDRLNEALAGFRGEIRQTPPMYSALKRDGKPLYEYARAGVEVERASRTVVVRTLDLVRFDSPWVEIDVLCSKGTYVRVLAEDIGETLGCGAHLAALRRTRVGAFDVGDALDHAALEALSEEQRDGRLLPVECLLDGYPEVELSAGEAELLETGRALNRDDAPVGAVRLYQVGRRFLGVGEVRADGVLQPKRLLRRV